MNRILINAIGTKNGGEFTHLTVFINALEQDKEREF